MKKCIAFIVSLMSVCTIMAQIQISPYIDNNLCASMPNGICELLSQKLSSVILQNGIQSQMGQSRFILTCNVTEESKTVLSTAPTMIAYVLDIHLYMGDGATGTKYTSQSFRTKGVGSTEEKAYRDAIKNLAAKSESMKAFVSKGCSSILGYYESNKDQILSSIRSAIAGKDLERAAYELCLIPQESSYYNEVQLLLGNVCSRIVDNRSSELLLSAQALWSSEQNETTANRVADIVAQIDANASCFADAQKFMKSVTDRMIQLDNRAWTARQRQLAHEREMAIARENNRSTEAKMRIKAQRDVNIATINAVRDVASEYAKSRPRVIYYVRGWY